MVLIAALVYGVTRTNLSARLLALLAIPISLIMFVVSVYQRAVGAEMVWPAGAWSEAAGRYAIVPALLLFSVAAVMIDRRSRRREGEGAAALARLGPGRSWRWWPSPPPSTSRTPKCAARRPGKPRSNTAPKSANRNRREPKPECHLAARLGAADSLRRTGQVRQVGGAPGVRARAVSA